MYKERRKRLTSSVKNSLLPFETEIAMHFNVAKGRGLSIPIKLGGTLEAIHDTIFWSDEELNLLVKWRNNNQAAYLAQVPVTLDSIQYWLTDHYLNKIDRLLFFIKDKDSNYIGHIGFNSLDAKRQIIEIDNVVRGEEGAPGIMGFALQSLLQWGMSIGLGKFQLRVFKDNYHAKKFYITNGFIPVEDIPIVKTQTEDSIFWKEVPNDGKEYERYLTRMVYIGL